MTGKRGLLILDTAGKEHSLARRIDGTNTKELNAFMRDVDRQALPTVEQAKERFQERKIAGLEADRATVRQEIEWEESLTKAAIASEEKERRFVEPEERKAEDKSRGAGAGDRKKEWPIMPPPAEELGTSPEYHIEDAARATTRNRTAKPPKELKGMSKQIMTYVQMLRDNPEHIAAEVKSLSAVLDDRGISLARVTKEEADKSHRDAAFARNVGRYAPRFQEDEIVAITEPRPERRRNGEITEPLSRIHKLDPKAAEIFVAELDKRIPLQGLDATLKASDIRAQERSEEREATRMERATDIRDFSRTFGKAKRPAVALGKAGLGIGSGVNALADSIASLFTPTLTPQQIRDAENAKSRRETEAERSIDVAQLTAELAQRQRMENERATAREHDRGGRDR